MEFQRYAVYFVPTGDELARFGASWLGWDPVSRQRCAHPASSLPMDEITARPGKYGLHGTVHWPFHPTDLAKMQDALAACCAAMQPVQVEGLKLARLGRFLALCPEGEMTALNMLAADIVQTLTPYRPPLSAQEHARRAKPWLTARQSELLAFYGYPHVMEHYRFHITLTDRLDKPLLETVEATLAKEIGALISRPFSFDALSLMGEDADGYFHQIARIPLTG